MTSRANHLVGASSPLPRLYGRCQPGDLTPPQTIQERQCQKRCQLSWPLRRPENTSRARLRLHVQPKNRGRMMMPWQSADQPLDDSTVARGCNRQLKMAKETDDSAVSGGAVPYSWQRAPAAAFERPGCFLPKQLTCARPAAVHGLTHPGGE